MWIPDWLADVSQDCYESLCEQYMPELPPVQGGAHLVAYLFELGPTVPAGMGAGPLTIAEIDPWCRRLGIDLAPWELRWLVRLSKEYLSESHKATQQFAPPPWIPDGAESPLTAEQAEQARRRALALGRD